MKKDAADDYVVVDIGYSGSSEVDCKCRVADVGLAAVGADYYERVGYLASLGYGIACCMEGSQWVQRNLVWRLPHYHLQAAGTDTDFAILNSASIPNRTSNTMVSGYRSHED
ncbi:hypothetical protein PIB30_047438 [Stylosanthes scabra]|uniref:Uncharacterized protein n=1 Tax=Stylosanthes scabra TaxID=79078 RepID=A0ABU6VGC0_9FABA|nr:hypothetical protein [Stylosanthes scabra]